MASQVDQSLILYNRILYKFKLSKINSFAIIEKCEKIDKNRDRMIHVDDLEEIIQALLNENRLTMREMIYLLSSITHNKRRGLVIYDHINHFFDTEPTSSYDTKHEKWRNDTEVIDTLPKGSIGEFLQKAACPAEIHNFKKFIHLIEKYEQSSGLTATATKEGFIVPLGPDLRVSIEFFMG
jgi:hypothetical protein